MSKFKFKKNQEVRILGPNTVGRVIRSWNDGNGNEYLVSHTPPYHGVRISSIFTEKDLKAADDVIPNISIYLAAFVFVVASIIIWSIF